MTKYAAPGNFMMGEIGRLNDVVFIETTQVRRTPNGAGAGYTADTAGVGNGSADRYDAIFIGDNAFGHAISLPVELRDGGILDFGREHALAWYAIWGLGLITDISVVTAATN
jgi:N4-gp56 family major capsid protein